MNQATIDLIVASVDYATVISGIGLIAAALGVVYVAKRGAGMLLGMISGGRG